MSIYIKGMEMPKDCPMCPMAHYNKLDEFTGCEVVPGRKYAARKDADYANSSTRPDWCPLVPVPPHGRLIEETEAEKEVERFLGYLDEDMIYRIKFAIRANVPTVIPANKETEHE